MMMNSPDSGASRINFEDIDSRQIERILKTGDLDALTPQEREYFSLMQLVRGLRARMTLPGGRRIVTKAGIIKLLKSDAYGLSDWMARRVYADSIDFFYSEEGISPRAWANFYAERLEKLADLAVLSGRLKDARGFITDAAKLRGCYDEQPAGIPVEILNASPVVVYSADPAAMGAIPADRKEIAAYIDALPDIPEMSRKRIREDAGVEPVNLLQRMTEDIREFSEDDK